MKSPRGFHYDLEPLRLKSDWDLLEVRQLVASCLRAVELSRSNVERLAFEVDSQHKADRQAGNANGAVAVEVERMRRSYVGLLARKLSEAEKSASHVASRHEAAVQQATQLQQFNDAIAQHREAQLRDHLGRQARMAAKEADDAWARRRFHIRRQRSEAP